MSQRGRPRMAYNQSRRMQHYQRNLNFVVPRGIGARHGPNLKHYEPLPRMPGYNEGDWCENPDEGLSAPDMLQNQNVDQQQHEQTSNFGPRRGPLCGPRPKHYESYPMDNNDWCEASGALEKHNMKKQQGNHNFVPRGKGHYGCKSDENSYDDEWSETFDGGCPNPGMMENHTEFRQRNSKLFPRGRQPHYNLNPNYRRPPSMQYAKEDNWCETCDRGFPTPQMLEDHKQQHRKCNIDGCQFVAHPKIITKHIQMQHSTGLFKKIANLNNPEDIKKWREERKNNYPTKINVEKKKAEMKEKIERGEKMGLKRKKYIKNGENQKRKHPQAQENDDCKSKNTANPINSDPYNTNINKKKKNKRKKEEMLPPPEYIRKLKPFAGILDLLMENNADIEDEGSVNDDDNLHYQIEDDDDCLPEIQEAASSTKSEKPNICGALSSLMCEYGSSDEEIETQIPNYESLLAKAEDIPSYKNKDQKSDEPNTVCTTSQNDKSDHGNISGKVPEFESSNPVNNQKLESDDDNPPEEVKIEKSAVNKVDEIEELHSKRSKKPRNKNNFQNKINIRNKIPYKKPNIPSTLLQKLLHREIQQERNIILQCIRHIVKNNYFDK